MAGKTQRAGEAAPRRRPSVFVVDDEPTLLDLAEAALQELPVSIQKFPTPQEALAAFRKARTKPAVLVTDYALGKMNGLELIAQCRKLHPELKVVMVSGHAVAEIALAAPAQVDRFLPKPYPPEALADIVKQLVG